jgi:hypothetical protein
LAVGKVRVVFPLTREIGENLDHVTDIDHEQERRIAMLDRKSAGVILCLLACGEHDLIPAACAPLRLAGLTLRCVFRDQQKLVQADLISLPLTRLLGFKDETAAPVAVDPSRGA